MITFPADQDYSIIIKLFLNPPKAVKHRDPSTIRHSRLAPGCVINAVVVNKHAP